MFPAREYLEERGRLELMYSFVRNLGLFQPIRYCSREELGSLQHSAQNAQRIQQTCRRNQVGITFLGAYRFVKS
jgi:hypothetical protein